ncbi:MAG: DUF4124 domain-containing protein [Gammaproteobacteria bacterium]
MKPKSLRLALACLAALGVGTALAVTPVYKWTDAQGVVHYSDKAPKHATSPVKVMQLPALPPVSPEAVKQEQASIASIQQWYQQVLNQQSQLEYDQFLAWQESQPSTTTPAPATVTEVSYLSPLCWDCGPLWHRRSYYRPRRDRAPSTRPPVFKSNIWSTQPNRFTQSHYRPR